MIKSQISDPQLLKSLQPDDIKAYLASNDWRQVSTWKDKATIWELNSPRENEVIVPNTTALSDYVFRVSEILTTLAQIESRSILDIFNSVIADREDALRIRAIHPDAEDGSIPLVDGVALIQGTYELLLAAATVVDEKRPYLPTRRSSEAVRYVNESARMAQSERGSYVLVVHSSLSEIAPNASQIEPFGRRVLETLADALTSLTDITEAVDPLRDGDAMLENRIPDFVSKGGSAQLCAALEKLNLGAQKHSVEISFDWSGRLPIRERNQHLSITVTPQMTDLTERIANVIRKQWASEEKTISGYIKRLVRENTYVATAMLEGRVDGRERHIRIHLKDDSDHNLVIQAYQQNKRISCRGTLVRRGRINVLEDYTDLRLDE